MVNWPTNWSPAYHHAKKLVDDGRIGRVWQVHHRSGHGGPPADYQSWNYATDAKTALQQLDDAYAKWIAGVRGLSEDDLERPCGPAEGPYADYPFIALVLHINREAIHHGAEIAYGPPEEIRANPKVIEAYLGEPV